jgi:DNA-binding transcriptional LysR family regulator
MRRLAEDAVSGLDLNLLRVLATVLEERSATAAARRLHVTQSAVSNSLARLRRLFGDPLLTRHGNALAPTPLALSLMPRLHQALEQMYEVVRSQVSFDPLRSQRRFSLACTDAHHFHDVPRLVAAFARHLPLAELRVVSPDFMESSDGLRSGDIDAALMPRPLVPAGQPCEEVYSDGFAFVVRRDNPHVGDSLTVEEFNAQRHIDTLVVLGRGGIGHKVASEMSAQVGLTRNIALSVPTFSAAGLAAAHSDFVAGLPARLAEILCTLLPLRQVKVPLPPLALPMCLTWHAHSDADPAARYFRELVASTLRASNTPNVSKRPRQRSFAPAQSVRRKNR